MKEGGRGRGAKTEHYSLLIKTLNMLFYVAEVRILRFFLLGIQIEHIYGKTYMETNVISAPRFG